jgi:protein disulfide-isomerase
MKAALFGLIFGVALVKSVAADLTWHTGAIAKPLQQAKAENKLVLLDFTGSDWCGYCKKLDAEVFDTPEFAEYVKKNLVLVKVDFPRSIEQTPQLKQINEALKKRYATPFEGYPTIVILDSSGKKLGAIGGYSPGSGPQQFITKLERLSAKK